MEVVTAESEEQKKEAAIGNTRRTPVVAKKAVRTTKPTATGKPTKPLVQSSLEAAVAEGAAAKETTEKSLKPAATARSKTARTIEPKSTAKEPPQSTENDNNEDRAKEDCNGTTKDDNNVDSYGIFSRCSGSGGEKIDRDSTTNDGNDNNGKSGDIISRSSGSGREKFDRDRINNAGGDKPANTTRSNFS
jgi:hypothetical protein